jgi:DNA polymerase-3 subunit delta'
LCQQCPEPGDTATGELDFGGSEERQQFIACGQCQSCRLFISGAHPDFRHVTFENHPKTGKLRSEIVVDQVRNLISALTLTTTFSSRKVALIGPAEAMNRNASNALLKTLEEPSGSTVFILVSSEPARLTATIRSRCRRIDVRQPSLPESVKWLKDSAGVDEDAAIPALLASSGRALAAKELLEQGLGVQFAQICRGLDGLIQGNSSIGDIMDGASELEPELLWSWLSIYSAERLRSSLLSAAGPDKENPDHSTGFKKRLSDLQHSADVNRRLLATSVRRDLLLQDWLIQCTRLRRVN